jgi:tRNA(Arg) A34 adenosine deaminase TadA
MPNPPSQDETYEPAHMARAIELAELSIQSGGGPFGAVVVKDDKILAEAHNQVVRDHDPTAHAEVRAIRLAAAALGDHVLTGCTVYSSCEPCPMCLGALFWSRVDRVWFAATREDAAAAGFDDEALYVELTRPLAERSLPIACRDRELGLVPMNTWRAAADKTPY